MSMAQVLQYTAYGDPIPGGAYMCPSYTMDYQAEQFIKKYNKYIKLHSEEDRKDIADVLTLMDRPAASDGDEFKRMMRLKLKPHQLTSLYYLVKWEKDAGFIDDEYKLDSDFCIFADPPGFGKTRTCVGLIKYLGNEIVDGYIGLNGGTSTLRCNLYRLTTPTSHVKKTIIIAPSTVIRQWIKELEFYGYSEWDTSSEESEEVEEEEEDEEEDNAVVNNIPGVGQPKNTYLINPNNINHIKEGGGILLFSNTGFKSVFGSSMKHDKQVQQLLFHRCMIDETDTINIPACPYVRAARYIFITATADCGGIKRVRNIGFIKDNFVGINSIAYCKSIIACTREFCESSFKMPKPIRHVIRCISPQVISIVKDFISPSQLEMLNAGNIAKVIEELGGIVDTDRNIITLVTRKMETQKKDLEAKLVYLMTKTVTDPVKHQEQIVNCKQKIESCNTRIQSIRDRVTKIADETCGICLCEIENPTMVPCCNNILCGSCIITALNTKPICPFCRTDLPIAKLLVLDNARRKLTDADRVWLTPLLEMFVGAHHLNSQLIPQFYKEKGLSIKALTKTTEKQLPTKLDALSDLLKKLSADTTKRTLVFSFHENIGDHLGAVCRKDGIPYGLVRNKIDILKDSYQRGDVRVLLMYGKVAAAGIDLPMTTDIIFFHAVEKRLEIQAIGRALRMGRQPGLPLHVHYLYYENEMEALQATAAND